MQPNEYLRSIESSSGTKSFWTTSAKIPELEKGWFLLSFDVDVSADNHVDIIEDDGDDDGDDIDSDDEVDDNISDPEWVGLTRGKEPWWWWWW